MPGESIMPNDWPTTVLEQVSGLPVDELSPEYLDKYSSLADIMATAFWASGMAEINPAISVVLFRKIEISLRHSSLSVSGLNEEQKKIISGQLRTHLGRLKQSSKASLENDLYVASSRMGSSLENYL